jgi:hypothetical protein
VIQDVRAIRILNAGFIKILLYNMIEITTPQSYYIIRNPNGVFKNYNQYIVV